MNEGFLSHEDRQAEQDRLFEDRILAAMHTEVQEDWRVMDKMFQENLLLMLEAVAAIHALWPTVITMGASTAPTPDPAATACSTPRVPCGTTGRRVSGAC